MSIAHIPKPMHDDRFDSWCGRRIVGFALTGLDHAAACIITGSLVQPCKKCIAEAVAILKPDAAATVQKEAKK